MTYSFYYGFTNVGNTSPLVSFILFDMHDFEGTIDIIDRVLSGPNYYENHFLTIREARNQYLKQYSDFNIG